MSHAPAPTIPATADHARAIAEIGVETWHDAYRAIMPATVLAARNVDRAQQNWARAIDQGTTPIHVAIAGNAVVGFASAAHQRSTLLEAEGFSAEITTLYVRLGWQRQGVGKALWDPIINELAQQGHERVRPVGARTKRASAPLLRSEGL
ncbi:MAG TPA: GNAT family N-acetyltransferase [Novosphingobium capsulatum]|jgi:GNAT superfamily N-acetyltransferase|nr:GNAT family N-acetyltransferase [Novosphingobium aromaticivorans]HIQ16392.1 GNAT family N-acetyltransferase [Novosphingobium capsulatum]